MNATVPMTEMTCGQCHMTYWVPTSFYAQCQEQKPHKTFFCPAGHERHFTGESKVDFERRLRQRAEQENARLAEAATNADRLRRKVELALKRQQKRAAAGVCPCCTRTFTNMSRHMKTKHPDFNVVPIKAAHG